MKKKSKELIQAEKEYEKIQADIENIILKARKIYERASKKAEATRRKHGLQN